VQKVLNKSPLNYSLAKALSAFDPRTMADSSCHEVNRTHLRSILKHMIEAGRISETDADAVQQQYTVFLDEVKVKSNYFIVRQKVDQRAGLLSLPHLGFLPSTRAIFCFCFLN